jgi:hypothetical protein
VHSVVLSLPSFASACPVCRGADQYFGSLVCQWDRNTLHVKTPGIYYCDIGVSMRCNCAHDADLCHIMHTGTEV